jgi:hypothetical protein
LRSASGSRSLSKTWTSLLDSASTTTVFDTALAEMGMIDAR